MAFDTHGRINGSQAKTSRKRGFLSTSALMALLASAAPAFAAEDAEEVMAEPPAGTLYDDSLNGDIVVTGSRIVRDGYDAPTPVSVISSEEINAEAPANIADFVNTLPSVVGSQTQVSNSGSLSNSNSGISALNLRSLGSNRTLVLLDGRRSVSSSAEGLVDVNTFPQALIQRVEVVTGGASAAYGSDAVGGVVNFVLDRDFQGIKANYEYGITTYNDIPNHKAELTAGTSFAEGRGHVVVSGEYFTQDGVDTIDRDWNSNYVFQINNPNYMPGNGQPERIISANVGESQRSPGGLITSGPFAGTYFGTIDPSTGRATLGELAFGEVSNPWMIGGDYKYATDYHLGSNSLANDEDRIGLFGRASFELSPAIELFGQVSWNRYEGTSYYQQTPSSTTIALDNAYLPENFRQMVLDYNAANGTDINSVTIGTSNAGIPAAGSNNIRKVERYVGGAEGEFTAVGIDLNWDAYYQYGKADLNQQLINTWQNSRMAAMQDAVYDSSGNIACRVNTDADPSNDLAGCVPINRIGVGGVTDEALDYLFELLPSRRQFIKQEITAFNLSTNNLFTNWAGPVSIAIGGEYRKESLHTDIDPINYETGWLYGNFKDESGAYNVKEAFIETVFPLFAGADFNGAFRITDYSTSGTVKTWKAGVTWQVIPDIKFRGTLSRDIRAGNLLELFTVGTARTNSVDVPQVANPNLPNRADQFVQNLTGNPSVKPEKADTLGLGVVFTPTFAPGLNMSVDYFKIDLKGAIGYITADQMVLQCFEQKLADRCQNILYANGQRYDTGQDRDITVIDLPYMNFSSQKVSGLDIEASYRVPLGAGELGLRGLASHYIENVTDDGQSVTTDTAGVNASGGTPSWTYRVSATYAVDGFTTSLVGRGISSGVYSNEYVECSSNCPESTPEARTINDNHIDGAFYVDANFSYEFPAGPAKAEAFISIKNLLNKDPVLIGSGPGGNNTAAYPQTNRSLYDTFGRFFRMGVRVRY